MARPKKPIPEEEVKKLAAINCSVEEIADFFEVDRRTIQRRFAAALKQGRANSNISLKRRMWETAMTDNKGAVTMQIWLSKQMLNYSDKVSQDVHTENQTHLVFDTQFGNETADAEAVQPASGPTEGPSKH